MNKFTYRYLLALTMLTVLYSVQDATSMPDFFLKLDVKTWPAPFS